MNNKYAILIDGGYFTKVFCPANNKYPSADEVEKVVERIEFLPDLYDKELLRIFYYDAPPLQSKVKNPMDNHEIDLGNSELAKNARKLHTELVLKSDFALRMGELKVHSWAIKPSVFKRSQNQAGTQNATSTSIPLYPQDIKPEIEQKGVDLKIGMDIACMALRQTVDTIVVITGDSDLVPALKLARREGLRVYCIRFEERKLTDVLTIHSDRILEVSITL